MVLLEGPPGLKQPPPQVVLELFAGCARFTGACIEQGLRVGVPCELANGNWFNLTCVRVQNLILRWIFEGRIWYVHLGTPCTRWSVARSALCPEPVGGLAAARFTVRVVEACRKARVFYGIENPRSSRLWGWAPLVRALRRSGGFWVDFPQCAYGTPYQKPTRLATNLPALAALTRRCTCGRHAEYLQGLARIDGRWTWKTSLASAYPPAFCRSYAGLLAAVAPARARRGPSEPLLSQRWERLLAASVGARPQQHLVAPSCPLRYRLPWRGAERRW